LDDEGAQRAAEVVLGGGGRRLCGRLTGGCDA
jgi:hypothetical protein